MGFVRSNSSRFRKNILIISIWCLFIYIWGVWRWNEAELFDAAWWFDTAGHAIFGFLGSFTFLYYYLNYSFHGGFRLDGQKILMQLVVGKVTQWAVIWEGVEMCHDFLIQVNFVDWLAKAQKGSADNTIDILTSYVFARIAMSLWRAYEKYYKKYSDEIEQQEIEEEIEDITERIERVSELIRLRRHEHLKNFLPKMKKAVKKFFLAIREATTIIKK